MDLEDTLAALNGLVGETVDVNIHLRGREDDGTGGLAHLSGVIERVSASTPGRWRVWFKETTPGGVGFNLDAAVFDGTKFDSEDTHPTYWIRQAGLVIEVMVYA